MERKNGCLSVNSENIFPIIKKWLYTEADIFVRELISNASDAITKRRNLANMGSAAAFEDAKIQITIDKTKSQLIFSDNGLGMDMEEIDRYINQIAFSGATDFLNRFKQGNGNQMIGHFGLGFYSAFMATDHISISTLSYKENAKSVYWDCTSDMKFTMEEGSRAKVGTDVILHLPAASRYLNEEYVEEIIKKYFAFFALPIELVVVGETEEETKDPRVVNDCNPLWTKKPEDCTKEEYVDFYKKAFGIEKEPKLWIHLYDEALGVKGIIYIRTKEQMDQSIDGSMKLYCKQVYISDEAKTLIPSYLFFQNGIIDCENAPLMVSRSALQEDESVEEMQRYITEQVAYKFYGTFECERPLYEEIWEDINPFIKFSCLKDKLFSSYINKFIIFKDLNGKYVTMAEHLAEIKDSHENNVYYISDEIQQAHYIKMFRQAGINALHMTHVVDTPYIRKQESLNTTLRFNRIDSDCYEALKDAAAEEQYKSDMEQLQQVAESVYGPILANARVDVKLGCLLAGAVSSLIVIDEEARRVRDTLELYESRGIDISGFKQENDVLLLNFNNSIVKHMLSCSDPVERNMIAVHLYDLARLGQESLQAQEMAEFIERSNLLLQRIF